MTRAHSGLDRLSVGSWVLYDLANTIFALGVIGRYFPEWLTTVDQPDSSLALVEAMAGLLVIFLAPWAGARSDVRGARVPTLRITTLIAVGATAGLAAGPITMTLILLGIGLVGFNVGSVVYDALLVDVSTPETRGRISGLGVGVGYIGSFIGLGIGVVTLEALGWSFAATFKVLALAFLVFALPSFVFIKERPAARDTPMPRLRDVPSRIISSWGTARGYDGMIRFLVGRFLYTDAINTLIGGFLTIFVIEELGLDGQFATRLLGLAIAAAIVGALVGGRLVEVAGPLRVLRAALVLWMIAIASGVAASVTGQTGLAWAIGPLGGLALGATWTADRVVMTRISPPRHLGEFYGLYATVGRFATILGPLTWALVVDGLGWGRQVAMSALIVFIAAGWWALRLVDDSEREWPPEDRLSFSGSPAPPR
ncbi:MAG TPA: MFS transporter [Acidimicrobiia bacterium]|nr:MFS transporter [Acidimicrobiia bacterium]